MFALLFCSLFALSDAAMTWHIAEPLEDTERRLAMQLTQATGESEPAAEGGMQAGDCIVGGYDTDHPEKVYVGGPCEKLTVTTDSDGNTEATPQTGFRWVEMEVVGAGILQTSGEEVKINAVAGTGFQHSDSNTDYAKVGTAGQFVVPGKEARLISGQTSYLVKNSVTFAKNQFAFEKDSVTDVVTSVDLCVAKCCQPADANTPCSCPAAPGDCPNTVSAQAGTYKFSVFLASKDSDAATAGTAGNGWLNVVESYGEGTPKELKGNFYVDQVIDFTNMNTDSVTLTLNDDTLVTYAAMEAGTPYSIKAISLASDTFSSSYSFPLLYNKGSWSNGGSTLSTDMTDTVQLFCKKTTDQGLVDFGYATDVTAAAAMKIVLVRYQFDISGVTGTANSGKWMTYDPVIKKGVDASVSNAAAASGSTSQSNDLVPSFVLLAIASVALLMKA